MLCRMDLVEVMGKENKKVPVLLTPATRAGIDQLINYVADAALVLETLLCLQRYVSYLAANLQSFRDLKVSMHYLLAHLSRRLM